MRINVKFFSHMTGKTDAPKPEPVTTQEESDGVKIVEADSKILGPMTLKNYPNGDSSINGVYYTAEELSMLTGIGDSLRDIHLVKQVFEGTVGEPKQKFNPVSCFYGGVERGVHPEACKWHVGKNDKNCHSCIRFASQRENLRKEGFYGRDAVVG